MAQTAETKVKKEINAYLDSLAPLCFHFAVHNMGYGKKGLPDRILCYRGFFVGIEIKSVLGKATQYQLDRNADIQGAGGVAEVVRSVDDVKSLLAEVDRL